MDTIKHSVNKALHGAQNTAGKVEKDIEHLIQPVQQSVFTRFPILFTLLVTFGVSTTFLAIEKIVLSIPYLNSHPFVMLVIGLGVLIVTGTLYKKLG